MNQAEEQARLRHWRRTRRLTLVLLAAWFGLTLGSIVFARELAAWRLFGWPLSSYLAAQGTLGLFLAIVGVYAWRMEALDRDYEAAVAATAEQEH